ncbi:MAG TPA: multicopper oxidase domain-containing protein, partial [Saliniramus sp.]|nr:multicopper oxidase domain-containing protein [Saliniramus sp.]
PALAQDALTPFVDPLVIPPLAKPTGTHEGLPLYEVTMQMVEQKVHRDLPPTPVFTYDGVWPGPTFDLPSEQPIYVNWVNKLPETYPDWLPVTLGKHVADKVVRTVVHQHGGVTPSLSDGFPERTSNPGETVLYHYPNHDENGDGAILWYHDHAMGNTRLNVYAGLSGFYLLRNKEHEETLELPGGEFEVPLVLQDRSFAEDGTLVYSGVCQDFGVVNGTVFPYMEVEPRRYRFRVLNGSNFRIMQLALSNGQSMSVLGVDDGFLDKTVETKELLLAPAERADFVVDFSEFAGQEIVLQNTTACAGPQREGEVIAGHVDLPHLMQFRVAAAAGAPDATTVPQTAIETDREVEKLVAEATVVRDITLDAHPDFLFLLENKGFDEPISIKPHLGDAEVWNLINLTDESHPIHIHLISYRIVERVPFTKTGVADYIRDRDAGTLKPLDSYLDLAGAIGPAPVERGPKDVALAPFGYVTRIAMRWYGYTGLYVIHCHILDHEDNDMMRPIEVLAARQE